MLTDATGPTYDLISALSTSAVISKDNVLVVGGTDGSGTRRVVQLLTKLGVTVVSEDPETYDIHADLFGGWPNVVTPVLTVSLN
jgi:spermidine synthase